jgi:hypothetical protein
MGSRRTRSNTSGDLFSLSTAREPPSLSVNQAKSVPVAPLSSRHVLPKDLPNAIKQLDDEELEQLLTAALAEQKRRGSRNSWCSLDTIKDERCSRRLQSRRQTVANRTTVRHLPGGYTESIGDYSRMSRAADS